ncbi:MAG: Fic family protein [Synergistales bacterium]|nr:Fic family protein [Synergistales bacterium]
MNAAIRWIDEDELLALVSMLAESHPKDFISIINYGPLGYVAHLGGLVDFYGNDVFLLASVAIRSIIQGHPLYDGNKRLGMLFGESFLDLNGIELCASDEDYFEMAIALAEGKIDKDRLRGWIYKNSRYT